MNQADRIAVGKAALATVSFTCAFVAMMPTVVALRDCSHAPSSLHCVIVLTHRHHSLQSCHRPMSGEVEVIGCKRPCKEILGRRSCVSTFVVAVEGSHPLNNKLFCSRLAPLFFLRSHFPWAAPSDQVSGKHHNNRPTIECHSLNHCRPHVVTSVLVDL